MTDKFDPLKAAYRLNEATEIQQEQIAALILELQQVATRYGDTLDKLPAQIAKGVNRALPEAAETAAKRIAANWKQANEHADKATIAYARAKRAAPWLLFGSIAAGTLFVLGLGTFIALKVLPNAGQIAKLETEVQSLRATIAELEKKGGRTPLAYCNDMQGQTHLCVRVDETRQSDVPGYRIVYNR
ncbi:hypothetical protein ABT364_05760 [Massilia sp. SR12]